MHNYSESTDNTTFLFVLCSSYSYVNDTIDNCNNIY